MTEKNDTVLIAVDESSFAQEALNWYIDHMHKKGNRVILAHCGEFPSLPSRDTWERQEKAGREKADALKLKCETSLKIKDIPHEFMMDFDKPGEFIVKLSKKEGTDVIIMGTRGLGKLRKTILGSVSDYVLHHAHCPVLICRSDVDFQK